MTITIKDANGDDQTISTIGELWGLGLTTNPKRLDAVNDEVRVGLWNGATYSRQYGNVAEVLRPLTAYSTSYTSAVRPNPNAKGIRLTLYTTVIGTATLELKLQKWDIASNIPIALATAPIMSGVGMVELELYPGATVVSTAPLTVVNRAFAAWYRVLVTHAGSGPATYSLTEELLV